MYIKELEIDNFKSCANKVTIPFLPGFTSIAGPNGSGKSNIIDSILFCLGFSTKKEIRADSLSDFVSTYTKRDDASVKITFADEQTNTDMAIERRIKKTNQGYISSYYLDGKAASHMEILEKLLKYNVSPDSYNVVMQSEVTKITGYTPWNRRKIIDDIAGVSDFDRKIEQATKELDIVENRVKDAGIILEEVNIRLESLKGQREEALKYQKLKEEKTKYESQISTVKYFDIKNSLERVHENILETNKDKKQKENELNKSQEQLDITKNKLQELSELVKQKGEDEQLKTKGQIEALKSDINTKKNAIELIDKQVENNKIAIENAKENIITINEQIDDAKLRIDNKKDEIKSLEKNIEHEKAELDEVFKKIAATSDENDSNMQRRNDLRKQLEDKKDEETNILKEIIPLEESVRRLTQDIDTANDIINNFDKNNEEKLIDKDKVDVEIEELNKTLKDYEIMQKNAREDLDKTKNSIDEVNTNINLAYRAVSKLEAQQQMANDFINKAVDCVMQADIDGVHAPLAQLGKVEGEYATALEIAMGGRMASVVVEDEEVAGICIDVLKNARAGRATFLPLNKIKRAPNNLKAPNINGVIDFAINLIDFDETYRDAFFHSLGETLVVEDRNTAQKLIGKYRMVDLEGTMYEKSAAITGGSINQNRIRFSSSESNELDKALSKLRDFQDRAEKLDRRKKEIEDKLDRIRLDYSSTMSEVNKKQMLQNNLASEISKAKDILEEKKNFVEVYSPELEENKKKLDSLKKNQVKQQEAITKIENEIKEVEESIPENELKELDDLKESIDFQIRKYNSDIIQANSDINNIKNEISFKEQAIEAQNAQIERLTNDNKNFAIDKKLNLEQIEQIQGKIDELSEKVKEIDGKLKELQEERDKVQNEVLELQNQKSNLTANLERLQENIEALKGRRKDLEIDLDVIRNELVEAGYQVASLQPVDISTEDLMKAIAKIEKKIEDLGNVNMMAIQEYDDVSTRQQELKEKIDTLSNERKEIMERMQGYEGMKRKSFLEAYEKINNNFKEICAELFDGTGSLVLENTIDPLAGGLTIKAQFRNKDEAKKLTGLSGGEKSLTALAFVFAIQRYLPAPFYALDEPDASLDTINVTKLAKMVQKQSKNTQFIVVTHKKPMIESANRTIGVTQGNNGVTKITGIKLSDE